MSTQVQAGQPTAGGAGGAAQGSGAEQGQVRAGARRAGRRRSSARRRRLVGAAALAALVVAMIVDTTFLGPEEESALNPVAFDAATYVDNEFPGIAEALGSGATDVTELAPALLADPAAAAASYGVDVGGAAVSYPITATGTVAEVDEDFAVIAVDGVPDGTVVRVPLGTALSGTPVRDAAGLRFSDFPGQTDYQSVANELGLQVREEVLTPADLPSLSGQEVTVTGAYTPGGPAGSFLVQPVTIEVAA